MKKLNVTEASNVMGGACTVSYASDLVNDVTVCRKVTTCDSKYGETVLRTPADLSYCSDVRPQV